MLSKNKTAAFHNLKAQTISQEVGIINNLISSVKSLNYYAGNSPKKPTAAKKK
jgi:hypothetical protein